MPRHDAPNPRDPTERRTRAFFPEGRAREPVPRRTTQPPTERNRPGLARRSCGGSGILRLRHRSRSEETSRRRRPSTDAGQACPALAPTQNIRTLPGGRAAPRAVLPGGATPPACLEPAEGAASKGKPSRRSCGTRASRLHPDGRIEPEVVGRERLTNETFPPPRSATARASLVTEPLLDLRSRLGRRSSADPKSHMPLPQKARRPSPPFITERCIPPGRLR